MSAEVVYFIADGDDYVKIGRSRNVRKRLETLQTSSPRKMRIVHTVPGGVELERDIHTRFSAYRERGEWFRQEGELRVFLTLLLFDEHHATKESGGVYGPYKTGAGRWKVIAIKRGVRKSRTYATLTAAREAKRMMGANAPVLS